MWSVDLSVGEESGFSVHRFEVSEGVSSLWQVDVIARSPDPALDLRPLVGAEASLTIDLAQPAQRRTWRGLAVHVEQTRAVTGDVARGGRSNAERSEYRVRLVPRAWLATQRVNHRVFQHLSVPEIVDRVIGPHATLDWKIDRAQHPKLETRVQYGESDFAFASRLLEETGISYAFVEQDGESKLVLADQPNSTPMRRHDALRFDPTPSVQNLSPCVREVRTAAAHRPGARVVTDYDFRNPAQVVHASSRAERPSNHEQEVHEYRPGGALVEREPSGRSVTPAGDDRGFARVDARLAEDLAGRSLGADRASSSEVRFESNQITLSAGSLLRIEQHPHPQLAGELFVTSTRIHGVVPEQLRTEHAAVTTTERYRSPATTPKPRVTGVESATVVGPCGEEIHVDEHGRVRVQFPWDREGHGDEQSFSWVRVAEGWAGTGYGMIALPRVGQEVLVSFLGGNPDQPVVVGRLYNQTQPVPYKLPDDKTVSGWRTRSSPGGDGYSELKIEDKKNRELVYTRAQRDRHTLVRRDRRSRVERKQQLTTVGEEHHVVKDVRRELVLKDSHLHVVGDRREKIDARHHVTVGADLEQKIGSKWAGEAGREIHLKAGDHVVIEAGVRLTLKGPGGFVDIHAGGVDVVGEMVRINSGGSAGSGSGAAPVAPDDAEEAQPMDQPVE